MSDFRLAGLWAALLTPFTDQGAVDWDALAAEAEYLDRAGVDGLCIGGYASETAGAHPGELGRICQTVFTACPKRPLIVNIYPDSTVEALKLADAAVSAGASALLVAQPHYLFQPNAQGLVEVFRQLRNAAPAPLLLSNNLPTCMVDLNGMRRLLESGLIDGVFQAGTDAHLLADLLCMAPRVPVLSGIEELMYVALLLGAQGAISVLASIFPDDCVELYAAWRRTDFNRAREIHEGLLRLWRALDHPAQMLSRLKYIAAAQGRPLGRPRSPYDWLPGEERIRLRRALEREEKPMLSAENYV